MKNPNKLPIYLRRILLALISGERKLSVAFENSVNLKILLACLPVFLIILIAAGCSNLNAGTANQWTTQKTPSLSPANTKFVSDASQDTPSSTTIPTPGVPNEEMTQELSLLNFPLSSGQVGWVHPSAILQADQNQQLAFRYEYPGLLSQDFILSGDLAWDSQDRSSGCGFSFRVQDEGEHQNLYVIILSQLDKGYIIFSALQQGEPANLREIYVNGLDPNFVAENGATNHLAIIANGNLLSIYLNYSLITTIDITQPPVAELNYPPPPIKPVGEVSEENKRKYQELETEYEDLIGQLDIRYQSIYSAFQKMKPIYNSGYAGLAVLNATGKTICKYTNSWLWLLNP